MLLRRSRRATPAGRVVVAISLLALVPATAHAHVGAAPAPHDIWRAWTLDPVLLAGLALGVLVYARGVRTLWRRAGHGRGIAAWRTWSFAAGLATLGIALVSPVDAAGSALFAAHMVQHLLLVMAAAPLVVLGDPGLATLWALPLGARRTVAGAWRRARWLRGAWHVLRHPLVAWPLHVAALWAWHAPALYERAVRDQRVHVLEHLCFFTTALLFWWVLADRHARARLGTGGALLYLFTAALQSTALGAFLTFAAHPWYRVHARSALAWGLTALDDQQLAGLIMWVPSSLVYLVAVAAVLVPVLSTERAALGGQERLVAGR